MERRRNRAAYLLVLFTLGLSLAEGRKLIALVLPPLALLHGLTVDLTYSRMLSRKMSFRDWALLTINGLPYLFLLTPYVLVPASIFLLAIALSYARFSVLPQVLGTAGLPLLYLPWVSIVGAISPLDLRIYLLWGAYGLVEALYVEYKLPHRRVGSWWLRGTWLAFLFVFLPLTSPFPILWLSLVEPTLRFLRPGPKLTSGTEIRRLGKAGARRTGLMFAFLLGTEVLQRFLPSLLHM